MLNDMIPMLHASSSTVLQDELAPCDHCLLAYSPMRSQTADRNWSV